MCAGIALFLVLHFSNLSWSYGNLSVISGFHVWRADAQSGPYAIVAAVQGPPTTRYIDHAVQPNHTYFYKVTAYDKTGDSAFSNGVMCQIPAQGVVSCPRF